MTDLREPYCVVVVTYRYPLSKICELLDLIAQTAPRIVLVDNTPLPEDRIAEASRELRERYPACWPIINGANLGLAKALNQGIQFASEEGYPWVLLFDQDSRPSPEMIPELLTARDKYVGTAPLAGLGPTIYDLRREGNWPFLKFRFAGPEKIWPDRVETATIETDMLITSGSLLSMDVIRQVGMMDETFFIDNIDLEWCFRARANGCMLLGVKDAVLMHHLGDAVRKVPGIGRTLVVHSPIRQYHISRNRILLYWRGYVPLAWKLHDFPRLLYKLLIYPLMVPPRAKNLGMILRGILHGLRRR